MGGWEDGRMDTAEFIGPSGRVGGPIKQKINFYINCQPVVTSRGIMFYIFL